MVYISKRSNRKKINKKQLFFGGTIMKKICVFSLSIFICSLSYTMQNSQDTQQRIEILEDNPTAKIPKIQPSLLHEIQDKHLIGLLLLRIEDQSQKEILRKKLNQ